LPGIGIRPTLCVACNARAGRGADDGAAVGRFATLRKMNPPAACAAAPCGPDRLRGTVHSSAAANDIAAARRAPIVGFRWIARR
jgi:hypothetical protein